MREGMREAERTIEAPRLDSWAIPGVPDVLLCSESGQFSLAELKIAPNPTHQLKLSGHQVSWLLRHAHAPVFVVVRDSDLRIRVYGGRDAVDLRLDGPDAVPHLASFAPPYDWAAFYELICPQ